MLIVGNVEFVPDLKILAALLSFMGWASAVASPPEVASTSISGEADCIGKQHLNGVLRINEAIVVLKLLPTEQ